MAPRHFITPSAPFAGPNRQGGEVSPAYILNDAKVAATA